MTHRDDLTPTTRLRLVKVVHSAAWLVFASAIVLIGPLAAAGQRRAAIWLTVLVSIECAVLVANGMRCPLTGVAARYTTDRRDNFDIYLPLWVARHNKTIFGVWFAADLIVLGATWT
jgi:hypothetical protein